MASIRSFTSVLLLVAACLVFPLSADAAFHPMP